ncbi:PHP domain-containing protein [Nitriliruptor alkaliphilus]|uniref:PHP domain-containing protein n=1 Tax=Nitriliruptor alkaliphilus TaxID=427918 RepID=UPI000698742C|nr:PHP domain-containing protein [Nitriliruptor alkaliphilus]
MSGFDLHSHTDLSDGTTSIEANVADAVALGLEGLGVTDHDTTAPFERAVAAAAGTGLELVLGTEFSAELDGFSVHVLGYWIDPTDQTLQIELDRLRDERTHRARAIVVKFNELDVPVRFERVQQLAGAAPIGRPHIAQAVVETGAASDTREVFDTWLADGGPAYVEKHAVSPVRAVELLRGAGGVAVLAHPGLYGARDGHGGIPAEVVEELTAAGLAGIEARHPDHTDEHLDRYVDLARALDLVVTAGSDYHGEAKTNRLGSATTPRVAVEALRARRPE